MNTLDDLEVAGKRVLVRSDLNVPLDGSTITDDGRIRASVPTLRALLDEGGRVIIASHLGRPKGQVRPELSLRPVAHRLSDVLDLPVDFVDTSYGPAAEAAARSLTDGSVMLLENVRFDPREASSVDAERAALAALYARLAEVFVSDGFGVLHRRQASVYEIARLLPSAVGELVRSEIAVLAQLTHHPSRPYAVVLGGAKVSDKLGVIANLLSSVDRLLIGGGMVYTFLAAQGHEVGDSMVERDRIGDVAKLLERAKSCGVEVVLPTDIVVASHFSADAPSAVVGVDEIPSGQMGLDIGPESAALFAERLADTKTVFWNGPMGVFEFPAFAAGTEAVARSLSLIEGLTVVGGGDSAAAVRTLGFADDAFGHISTGGGASLEYLEGKSLPGLSVLEG